MSKTIVVAGATGNLGLKIVAALVHEGVDVKCLVRKTSDTSKLAEHKHENVSIISVDYNNEDELISHLKNADVVVSVLSGLGDVIIDTQARLLNAAIKAGVNRFIPSDFSSDFTNLQGGKNRNLDFRKKFHDILNKANIKSTSIFNGAFMELTTGEMPLIMFDKNKILHWGSKDVLMDFTHTCNIASYTAKAAMDDHAPRYLKIAGERISPSQVADLMSSLTNSQFKLFRPGGIGLFNFVIKLTRFFSPSKNVLYPAWQGMQYMRDMMEGRIDVVQNDNARYKDVQWISLSDHLKNEGKV